MRIFLIVVLIFISVSGVFSQGPAQRIYETERAFEQKVAEQGINAGFIEYMAPDGILFAPDKVNGREMWRSREASPAGLTWNPILIDVASNGVLAYSLGNSIYRPKAKDDTNAVAGHYLSIWVKQADGEYRAVLDTGISHEKPSTQPTSWISPTAPHANLKKISAADSSTGFYQMAESSGLSKAFKAYLAEDVVVYREGKQLVFGKKAALKYVDKHKGKFRFAKIKSFLEADNLAYVHAGYSVLASDGTITGRGNFVQVWKFIDGNWRIVADVLIPIPAENK